MKINSEIYLRAKNFILPRGTYRRIFFDSSPDFINVLKNDGISAFLNVVTQPLSHKLRELFGVKCIKGGLLYDDKKPVLIIVNNDVSPKTPIIGLKIGEFAQKDFNIIFWFERDRALKKFVESSVLVISGFESGNLLYNLKKKYPIYAAIVNSAESSPTIDSLFKNDIPIVTLLNEYSENNFSRKRVVSLVAHSDRVVVTSPSLYESIQSYLKFYTANSAKNIVVFPHSNRLNLTKDIEDRSNFAFFFKFVRTQIEIAKECKEKQIQSYKIIQKAGCFDSTFYHADSALKHDDTYPLKHYIAYSYNGLCTTNPLPGFHSGIYLNKLKSDEKDVLPLVDAMTKEREYGTNVRTHSCLILGERKNPLNHLKIRVAIHLHLHYDKLAKNFFKLITKTRMPIDLFITSTSEKSCENIQKIFSSYSSGNVKVILTPNRGRDIGSFLNMCSEYLKNNNYDVIGHFHGKQTAHLPDKGDGWRNYLFNILIGNEENLKEVLNLFVENERLGLVFAEDRHFIGWTENYAIAQDLAYQMKLSANLPAYPIFPVGTMFWTRPDSIKPLLNLGLTWSSYPEEPIKIDGTILHAIERLLTIICESQGFTWQTVYRNRMAW